MGTGILQSKTDLCYLEKNFLCFEIENNMIHLSCIYLYCTGCPKKIETRFNIQVGSYLINANYEKIQNNFGIKIMTSFISLI